MTGPQMFDPDRGNRTSRILLIIGSVLAVVSVVSWFAFGSGKGNKTSDSGRNCRAPAHSTTGTEPPPHLVAEILTPLGQPTVSSTVTAQGTTVYTYCYDSVLGSQPISAIATLNHDGYDQNPGSATAQQQAIFTSDSKVPYGINLTVNGDLVTDHPSVSSRGGLSVTWLDTKPTN